MKTQTKSKFNKNVICLFIMVLTSYYILPLQAQIVRNHRNQTTFKPINHYWNSKRLDNQLAQTTIGKNGALGAKYRFVRLDGYIMEKSFSIEGHAVPLYFYYNKTSKDNFSTASQ